MIERLKDFLLLLATILLFVLWTWHIYDKGVDAGWYEHEAEENAYNCEVLA